MYCRYRIHYQCSISGQLIDGNSANCLQSLGTSYPIAAKHLPTAFSAVQAVPYGIELVGGGIDQRGVVGQDACLEIAGRRAFHAGACTGQIGRADVGDLAIEDQHLEVSLGQSLRFSPLHSAG